MKMLGHSLNPAFSPCLGELGVTLCASLGALFGDVRGTDSVSSSLLRK